MVHNFSLLIPPRHQVTVMCAVNHFARELYRLVSARVEVPEDSFVIFTRFGIGNSEFRSVYRQNCDDAADLMHVRNVIETIARAVLGVFESGDSGVGWDDAPTVFDITIVEALHVERVDGDEDDDDDDGNNGSDGDDGGGDARMQPGDDDDDGDDAGGGGDSGKGPGAKRRQARGTPKASRAKPTSGQRSRVTPANCKVHSFFRCLAIAQNKDVQNIKGAASKAQRTLAVACVGQVVAALCEQEAMGEIAKALAEASAGCLGSISLGLLRECGDALASALGIQLVVHEQGPEGYRRVYETSNEAHEEVHLLHGSAANGDAAQSSYALIVKPDTFVGVHRCTLNPNCEYASSRQADVERHMCTKRCLRCPICRTRFRTLAALQEHEQERERDPALCVGDSKERCVSMKPLAAPSENYVVWDTESTAGSNDPASLENPQDCVFIGFKCSPALQPLAEGIQHPGICRRDLGGGSICYHTSPGSSACAVYGQFLGFLYGLERALRESGKWDKRAYYYALRLALEKWYCIEVEGMSQADYLQWAKDATLQKRKIFGVEYVDNLLVRLDTWVEYSSAGVTYRASPEWMIDRGSAQSEDLRDSGNVSERSMRHQNRNRRHDDLLVERPVPSLIASLRAWFADESTLAQMRASFEAKFEHYRSEAKIILWAHNSGRYDTITLLRTLVSMQESVRLLKSNGTYLEVELRGFFKFRDTMRHLAGSLASNAEGFGLGESKGLFPYTYFDERRKFVDRGFDEKPDRRFFTACIEVPGPLKGSKKVCGDDPEFPLELYQAVPGRDPRGELHGSLGSKYNPYAECAEYCCQDVNILSQLWERWRTVVRESTAMPENMTPHARVDDSKSAVTVLSFDIGLYNNGVCLLRYHRAEHRAEMLWWDVLDFSGPESKAIIQQYLARVAKWTDTLDAILMERQPEKTCAALKRANRQIAVSLEENQAERGWPCVIEVDPREKLGVQSAEWRVAKALVPPAATLAAGAQYYRNKKHAIAVCEELFASSEAGFSDEWRRTWGGFEKKDDAADALLQAVWWLREHCTAGPSSANGAVTSEGACERCMCGAWHCAGADPNNYVTISQMGEAILRSTVSRRGMAPPSIETEGDGEIRDRLCDRFGFRNPQVPQRESRPRFIPEDAVLSVLTSDKEKFCRGAIRGGRCEVDAQLYEISPSAAESGEFIKYADVNSEYPYLMKGDLPSGHGCWLPQESLTVARYMADPGAYYGVLQVDLDVPRDAEYPVLGEKKKPPGGTTEKLMFDNTNKRRYTLFSEHLRYALEQGCVLRKVHRALHFQRSPWLREYVLLWERVKRGEDDKPKAQRNLALRQAAKLLMNATFGKTLQKIQRDNIAIVYARAELEQLLRDPKRKVVDVYPLTDEAIEVTTVERNPRRNSHLPPSAGAAILAGGQTLLHSYMVAVEKAGGRVLYCDTDSLIFASHYDLPNEFYHPSEFGKLKDELPGEIVVGFAGVGAKTYALKLASGNPYARCKGVSYATNNEAVSYAEFRGLVLVPESEVKAHKGSMQRTKEHGVYWVDGTSTIANRYDKRSRGETTTVCEGGAEYAKIHTLAHRSCAYL